jgi:lysyl-tRNA synthetase class 2
MTSTRQWQPTITLKNLRLRSDVLWKLRSFFREAGFDEVQTPILSRDTVVDRHIDPVVVAGAAVGVAELRNDTLYLQTSPEFAMKRLLAAGAQRIFQIGSVFRAEERGDFHNPEFTMLEWYRTGDDLDQATIFLTQLLQAVCENWQPYRITYQQAFINYAGLCPLESTVNELSEAAVKLKLGVDLQWSLDRDDWLNLLFSEAIQPKLGLAQPEIVTHYPASQSALARVCSADSRVVERFELFVDGVELANGYHELLNADELASRNVSVNQQRIRDNKPTLPESSRLIEAMRHGLPACSGCALGLDRLLMVLSKAARIDEVIYFPIERA